MFLRKRRKILAFFVLLAYFVLAIYLLVIFENYQINPRSQISIPDLDLVRRMELDLLQESIKKDKGVNCEIPVLDPLIVPTNLDYISYECPENDWVECIGNICQLTSSILQEMNKEVQCVFKDILYHSDKDYTLGPPTFIAGTNIYKLVKSDFVDVQCIAYKRFNGILFDELPSWKGTKAGLRETVPKLSNNISGTNFNVLILLIDSISKNQFIREMPKSNKILPELGAVTLKGYNIVGDGTPAALFPILTGKSEVELPETRKMYSNKFIDEKSFLFHQLGEFGYRTAFYEDMPWIGTFQRRFNGFGRQPADHYLYPFMLEEYKNKNAHEAYHCVGDGPTHGFMLDLTWQFHKLDGKKFSLTVFVDINHEITSSLRTADKNFEEFLTFFKDNLAEDTMLILMGDHGRRYTTHKHTFQDKLEERMPLMSIVLPKKLLSGNPYAYLSLIKNEEVLTTPFDIHATILDVIGLSHLQYLYTIPNSLYNRSLSLISPIPKNRTCGDAGILPHWCVCIKWFDVPSNDDIYLEAAENLLNAINDYTEVERSKCALRTLKYIEEVKRKSVNEEVLYFQHALDADGYFGVMNKDNILKPHVQYFQVQIVTDPGAGIFIGTLKFYPNVNYFVVDENEISRVNKYGSDPHCVSADKPHLNKYCFCKNSTLPE